MIISFFTPGYESSADRLRKSCDRLNLEHHIEKIACRGSWEKNCCYKPQFIFEKLAEFRRPLLWIDADGEILEQPKILSDVEEDTALRINTHLDLKHPSRVATGTLFVKPTKSAVDLLARWRAHCLLCREKVWDQICLREVLPSWNHPIFCLPEEYCTIYDKKAPREAPIIVHYQNSRQMKKVLSGELTPFWQEKILP